MKFILSLLCVNLLFSTPVFAEDHSENVCSVVDNRICGHLGYHWGIPTTSSEAQFLFHVMGGASELTDLKIDLWMESMGHGTSPVKLERVGVNKYKVSEAFFIMEGEWLVRADFNMDGQAHHLEFAVKAE